MASKPVKREADQGWNVVFSKKKCIIYYNKCVICQEHAGKLNTIQKESWEKPKISSEARKDKTALLLHEDIQNDSWLEDNKPVWSSIGTGIFSRRATLWTRERDLGVCLIPHS